MGQHPITHCPKYEAINDEVLDKDHFVFLDVFLASNKSVVSKKRTISQVRILVLPSRLPALFLIPVIDYATLKTAPAVPYQATT